GFMSTLGSMPAARACSHCATPISPPATTRALLDMFCALNGTTSTPSRLNHRHSAVTRRLLPASDVHPKTMIERRDMSPVWRRRPSTPNAGPSVPASSASSDELAYSALAVDAAKSGASPALSRNCDALRGEPGRLLDGTNHA